MSHFIQQEKLRRLSRRLIEAMAFFAVCMCGAFNGTPAKAYHLFLRLLKTPQPSHGCAKNHWRVSVV
jgi:hypothetical protein